MKRFFFASGVFLMLSPATVLAVDGPVFTGSIGGGCGVVLMASGDLYAAQPGAMNICPWSLGPWQLVGNVFVNGGGGTGPVVGMDENGQVMCASGDWFQLGISVNACSGFSATFLGNVFAITGARAPGETVAAFGGNGGAQYAVTNLGSVFRWLGCNGTWERHGSLNTGPTATSRRSWGELKVLYR